MRVWFSTVILIKLCLISIGKLTPICMVLKIKMKWELIIFDWDFMCKIYLKSQALVCSWISDIDLLLTDVLKCY